MKTIQELYKECEAVLNPEERAFKDLYVGKIVDELGINVMNKTQMILLIELLQIKSTVDNSDKSYFYKKNPRS